MAILFFRSILYHTRFWAKLLLYYWTLFISAFSGFVLSIILFVLGKSNISQWGVARICNTISAPALNLKMQVENEHFMRVRPCVFVSNHQSELDILLLGRLFPKYCSIVSKKSLKYVPFLGWFMILSKTIFIDRAEQKNSIRTFEKVSREIKANKVNVKHLVNYHY